MVTSAVKDGKLYHLTTADMAKIFIDKTTYEVYFVTGDKPMVRVNESNYEHFKKKSEEPRKYFSNQFMVAFDIPSLDIHIDERQKISVKSEGCSGYIYNWLIDYKEWENKQWEERYIKLSAPLHEARKRGENPEWDISSDDILKEIKDEYNEYCGVKIDKNYTV